MSNKSEGNRFEQELAKTLFDAGFWVHVLQQNKSGQPADIIAVKEFHRPTLIDCKDLKSGERFPLDRIEENQKSAMKQFTKKAGSYCWFAIRFPDGEVYMLQSDYAFWLDSIGKKSISQEELDKEDELGSDLAYTLNNWLYRYGSYHAT